MLIIEHPETKELVEVPDLVREAGQAGIDKFVDLVGSGSATPEAALAAVLPAPTPAPEATPAVEPPTTDGGTS